jgi:hypothetical protein
MALKYYAYFNSTAWAGVTSIRYKIEIYDTTFSGTATEVTTGANPFSEKELNNEETTYGIKGCRFDIDIVSDVVTVEDFYTQEGMSHRVKLYEAPLVGDMTLIRDGYLLSEDVQEVYQDGIKVIQLSGTDGLELLKTIPFEFSADKPYSGVMTALLLLDRCVTPIGLELNVNTSFNYYQDGQSKIASFEPLAFFNVHAPLFKGKTCYEALNMLCETLRCIIFQEDGEWWFIHTLNPDNTTQYYRKWDSDFNSLSSGTLPSAITVEFEGEYAPFNGNKLKKRSYKKSVTEVDLKGYVNKLRNADFQDDFDEWNQGVNPVEAYSFGGLGTNKDPYYIQIEGYMSETKSASGDYTDVKRNIYQNVLDLFIDSTPASERGALMDKGISIKGKAKGNDVKNATCQVMLTFEFDSADYPPLYVDFYLSESGEWTPDFANRATPPSDENEINVSLIYEENKSREEYSTFEVNSVAINKAIIERTLYNRIFQNKLYKLNLIEAKKCSIALFLNEGFGRTSEPMGASYDEWVRFADLSLEVTDKSRAVGLKKNRYISEQSTTAPNELKIESHFADHYDAEQFITILKADEVTPTVLWEDINGNNTGELLTSLNRELLSLYYKPTSLYDGDILGKIKKYHKINLAEYNNELININWNFDFGQTIASGVRYVMTFANYGTFTNSKLGVYNDDKEIPYDDVYPTGSYEYDEIPVLNGDLISKILGRITENSIVQNKLSFSKLSNESGINWYDSITGDKTDYFLTTADGFVMKSEISPYEVTLDFTELTANTKLIIPPLSADAYLLTSENGWVLEGNNISTAKKLGSTTAQDWTIIHTNNTIATVNSSGINLGENLLSAGGVQFDLTPTQTGAVGKLMWNDTDGTLEFGMKGGNVTQQIGQELPVLVKHADNTGLANGAVVYVVGSDGSNKTVRYALANAESTSSKTFGVMTEDASGGSKAFCTTFGIVRNIDTSALTEGASVYLSPTVAGGMTTTKPSAPNHMVLVGFCIRSHATLGSIFVKIINGFELNEIHDVAIGTLANNNLLAYESATSLWKNKTYSELGLFPTPSGLTTNYVSKWNGMGFSNSQIFDNGTNVGIGTATPATLLDVRGQISASLGSASAPAFSFVGDLNTGVYSPSADTVSIATGGVQRITVSSAGSLGIGTSSLTGINLRNNKAITGGGSGFSYANLTDGAIQSDVIGAAWYYRSQASTQATTFTLPTLLHFHAAQGTFGAGSTVSAQTGFYVDNTLVGATTNYGFRGAIPSGSNRWNAFMDGTAQNHFRGNVGIGLSSTVPATELEVRGVISASLGSASLPSHTFVGDLNNGWWSPAADTQAWSLSGAEVMRLNATGLGIGVTPSYKLDVSGTGHFTGAVTFDTVPSSLQDASSANHLVRYSQWISSTTVKYLPTAVKTVSLTNITLLGVQTINGVTLIAGDRVLVMGQTVQADNGIYVVAAGVWVRATDSDTDTELRGYIINVSSGTYAGYKYINTNASTITVGTTAITYSEFSNVSEIDPVFVSWRDTSRTANTFWAAPNGSNGAGTWRAIVATDIPTLNQNTTGSAATLTTSRNIAISGDLTWNVDFNGSAAVTAVGTLATVNSNVGTFAGITVNGKGLVTAATALTTLSGYGITDAQSTLVSGTNIKTVGTYSLLGSGDVTLASLNYWTKSGSDVSYVGGNVYAPYFESNGAMVAFASTGTDNYTILGVGSTSFQQKVYDVTNQRLETISSAGVLGTIFNGGNYRFGTGTDSGLAKVQVVGAIQQSSVTSSYIKANASGVLIAGTITTSDVSDLSSYTGFDARYFTETESDARFVALSGSYANPTWITSLAWSKLTSVPSTFTPSAHTLDSHSNVTITSNSNGEILKWNGSAWINNTLAEAGIQATLNGTGFVKSTSGVISYDTNTYLTGNQTISISGDATGSGATSIALTLANSGVTSGTYRSVTVNAKGLVTGATNPTTISGYGITDFYSQVVSGFVTGANSSVLNTDTLEVALEKLQGQINARISGNQTITLSGIVTGSGTTAITTAIADSALSIAKTSGLQTALDGKFANPSGLTTNYVSKWNGTGFSNSQTFDNGTSVGIGTASPSSTSKLHVNNVVGNSVRFQNTYFSNTVESNTSFARGGIFNNAEYIDEGGATKVWKIRNIGANDAAGILFRNNGTLDIVCVPNTGTVDKSLTHSEFLSNARVTVLASGFVGINNTSPAYTLDVVGTIRTTSLMITSGATVGSFLKANNVNGTSVWASITTSDISNLGTANQLLRVNSGATALEYFTPTYISGNQSITLSGIVTGSGTTAITTSIANGAITNAMLANTAVANLSGTNTGDNSPNSLYSGLVSNATHTGDATGATSLTVVGIRGVSLPTLGVTAGFLRYTGTSTNTWVFDTSTYLTANQSISITGDATGTGTTSIALTLANVATAGTYRSVTINSKGLVTSGTNPTTISGYGITDFYSQVVSGFVTGANSTVLNTDTLEVALEKLQGQINARISGNQTITLSGVITGSGTTAITTSIADGTLSIAKTSGLQTALDSKMTTTSYPDLVAIEALAGTSGFLKKTAANTWLLDTNTYLTANQTITLSGDVSGSGTTSITATLATITQASTGNFRKITLDTKGRVTGNTAVVIGDLTALGATTLTSFSSTATGLTYTNTTGVFSLTSGYSIPTTANQTNWSTAYGWGNHASAGYLTTSTAASTYQPILPSGTAGQFLIRNASNALEFSTLELEPVSLSNNKIAVGDSANYLSEYNNFEFLESRFISIYRPSDSSRALYMGMYSLSNNSFITAAGGNLTLKGDTGIYLHGFTGFGNKMVIVDGDGKLGYTDIPSGGSGSSSLTSTYIGYGSTVNTLTGNSTFTYLDNRYIHLTSSGSNFNLGTFSSAGFIESVNGNLLLQARSTFGVVVDEGYFQVDALGGGGTKMVVVDNNGKFGTQTIPSGGGSVGTVDQVLAAGNTSYERTFNLENSTTNPYIHFKNNSGTLKGNIIHIDNVLSFNATTGNKLQLSSGADLDLLGTNINIGYSNTTGLINIQGMPFNFNEEAQNGGSGANGSQWGSGFNQGSPQAGDRMLFFYDGTRWVPSHLHTRVISGYKCLTID